MKYTDLILVRSKYTLLLALLMLTMAPDGCIDEDDGTPAKLNLPVVTIADYTIKEGDVDQVLQLEVILTGENKTNAIVTFSAVSVTAESNLDYEVITSGQLIFAPDENKKVIEITIVGDEAKETKETFQVKLYNPMNTYIEKDISTITVEDDDDNTSGLVIPSGGYQSPTSYDGYTLKWADEFDGESLNLADWTFEIGDGCPNNCGWGNNELQYYREDNTSIVDGKLVITAKEQKFGDRDYTSSRIVTKGKQQFKFGRIDIRAALPKGQGIWPALWMLGSNIDAVGWPACGEIDIMELTGDLPNRILGTIHYGANVSQHQFNSGTKYLDVQETFQDEFHVFSINWENNLIEFLLDGEVYYTITPATLNGAPYPFNKNQFFIFNVAVGGNFPGSPDSSTPFPQHMIVDYIRVFQK